MENDKSMLYNDEETQYTFIKQDENTLFGTENTEEDGLHTPLAVGSTLLNKYIIIEVLGNGNFGMIYRVKAKGTLQKSLVVKEFFPKGYVSRAKNGHLVLKESLSEQDKKNYKLMYETFIGEAKNLEKVTKRSHPNIVTIFALEENVNNTSYFVMNHESGVSLKEYMLKNKGEENTGLHNSEIKNIATSLLDGLAQMHNLDVYHQDVKLDNILIKEDGSPLLLDFGSTTILFDPATRQYFNSATPRYAAIEQVNLDSPPTIDQRTDIYAVGVTLYKLITDTLPPKSIDRIESINKGGKDPYVPLQKSQYKEYDAHLLSAVNKAMSLSQEDRFEDAIAFKNALLNKKKRKRNIILGLVLLALSVLGAYFAIPKAKGNLHLDSLDKNATVQIDGKTVTLGHNNFCKVTVGKHNLEIIKDGSMPIKKNIKISTDRTETVDASLMPLEHFVEIQTTPEKAVVEVNGKVSEHRFMAKSKMEQYHLKISAPYYETQEIEKTYKELYKEDFVVKSHLQKNSVKVTLENNAPTETGTTQIYINKKRLAPRENFFTAYKDKMYKIEIVNPYYKPKTMDRSFNTLLKLPTLSYRLEREKVAYTLVVEPRHTKIVFYQKINGIYQLIFKQPREIDHKKTFLLPASNDIKIVVSKDGYKELTRSRIEIRPGIKIPPEHIELKSKTKGNKEISMIKNKMIDIKGQNFKMAAFEVRYYDFEAFLNDSKEAQNNKDKEGKRLYNNNLLSHFIKKEKYMVKPNYRNMPVNMVTWHGANAYAKWLSKKDVKQRYALPTANQWTAVAKLGYKKNNLDQEANYDIINTSSMLNSGSMKANSHGIYDLFGNLFEWTNSEDKSSKDIIKGVHHHSKYIIKGGSYRSKKSFLKPSKESSAYDNQIRRLDIGFRLISLKK